MLQSKKKAGETMIKKNNKLVICIVTLFAITLIGLILFFTLANRRTEIYAISYDEQIKFSLGKYEVESFNVSSRNGNSITKTKSAKEILEKKIIDSPYLYASHDVQYKNYSCINYIVLYDGYYFVVWIDSSEQLVIENMVAEFHTATTEFFFTFPKLDLTCAENDENYYIWEEIGVNDFTKLATMYSNLKNSYCEIDEETKTIKLNCCDANNFRDITTSFPITIKADSNGLYLLFDSEGLYND